jgi:hypothetical protein
MIPLCCCNNCFSRFSHESSSILTSDSNTINQLEPIINLTC